MQINNKLYVISIFTDYIFKVITLIFYLELF